MDETSLRLDGNALAGTFQAMFAREMTAAQAKCGNCGRVEPVGAEHVYMRAPGPVVRCRHCNNVLMVLVEARGRSRLTLQGCRWLEMTDEG